MNGINQKAAEILDMQMPEDENTLDMSKMLVPVDLMTVDEKELVICDNPEIPAIINEVRRIEEGLRQNDELLRMGTAAVMHSLAVIPLSTPQYQARAVESSAALFSAIADLNKFKVDSQMKLIELKMKLDSYTRVKSSPNPGIYSGKTIVFTGSTTDALKAIREANAADFSKYSEEGENNNG
jgi:hypothetical protein